MDEQLLIAECKKGKSWAFKSLYELYAPAMMGLCLRYVNDREVARDILQDGFVKVFTKIDSYTGAGAFAGWVRRIFVTTALEYLRTNNVLKNSISFDDVDYQFESVDVATFDGISAEEIQLCIEELPPSCRTIFNLYAVEGYTHDEIASMLNIQKNTSYSQFVRARKMLQQKINEYLLKENVK